MQDIVFYAAANEKNRRVRDYSNMRGSEAPVLTLGSAVCLRMRLFKEIEDATPYPIDSLSGIVCWQWSMDADFDRSTACKLVADTGAISVHTVTDTIKGETMNFTEFVIPISNMNTQELTAWLGNAETKTGLIGELVGYDGEGHTAFVLLVKDFTVQNRLTGSGEPTAVDQEYLTRTQAESLIQTAVSATFEGKQDKLTSANAGTGISISSNGTISADNIPQSAISGLTASLAAKQDIISAGDLMELSGNALNRKRYMNIVPENQIAGRTVVIDGTTANALVLEPGNAYRINAVSAQKWIATTAEFKETQDQWGLESHIELFTAGTGFVRTDSNVFLANALEPDAVNNCVVRFHDGRAIIDVEDHIAGCIVINAGTSGEGSLACALTSAGQEYIAFDASLNGTAIDLSGSTANGVKHVVGNGYTGTVITGNVDCGTSNFTVANLALSNVGVIGGVMTFSDAFIPPGSTVSVNGGGLAIEKVTGAGSASVIDLGGNAVSGNGTFSSVSLGGGTFASGALEARGGAAISLDMSSGTSLSLAGINTIGLVSGSSAEVFVSSGAIIDLTGNKNAEPIAPGGAITFAPGGATVYPSQGLASAYTLDGIVLPAGAKLSNVAKVALHGTHIVLSSGTTAGASGCIISGGRADSGGALVIPDGAALVLSGCEVTGNVATATSGGGGGIYCNGQLTLSKCYLHANTASGGAGRGPDLLIQSANARVDACDCRIGRMTTRDNGTVALHGSNSLIILNGGVSGKLIVTPGATLDLTSATESINPGSGVTLSAGSATEKVTVIGSGGQSRTFEDSVISGTSISKIGAIYGATITDVPGPDYYLTYTTDNGATSNTVYLNDTAPTYVSAEFGSSAGALSVFKSNS